MVSAVSSPPNGQTSPSANGKVSNGSAGQELSQKICQIRNLLQEYRQKGGKLTTLWGFEEKTVSLAYPQSLRAVS